MKYILPDKIEKMSLKEIRTYINFFEKIKNKTINAIIIGNIHKT